MVFDLEGLRTIWHERAVVAGAKRQGEDAEKAIADSRQLRTWAGMRGIDLRLPIAEAKRRCELTGCR